MAETDWPHLLADLTAKRDALNQVIELLTTTFVRDAAPVVDNTPPRKKTRRTWPRAKPGRKRKAVATSTLTRRRRRSADGVASAAIVAHLKAHGSGMRPGALAAALKIPLPTLRYQLKPLLNSGAVLATGVTASRLLSLPPRSANAREPAQPGSTRIDIGQPVSRSAVEAVEARDRAILAFLEEGEASFEAVVRAIPNEPGWTNGQRAEACTLALRRLRLKNQVRKVGDTWLLPT